MYKLVSGDIDNNKHIYMLEVYDTLRNTIKKNHSNYNVQASIFSGNFDEKDYDDIVSALTIGDELSVPISEEEARVLFFALNVNMNNYDSRIRSISKAYIFYNDFEGDYEKVTFIDTKHSIIHIAKIFYHDVVPGVTIQYKIPFYVVNSSSGYHFTIAECDKYSILINDQVEHITRKSFYRLLDGNYAKSFRNHEEVMNILDTSTDVLLDCITDAEFSKKRIDFPFDNPMCLEFSSDGLLFAWENCLEESDNWINKGNKFLLNERYDNIVPMVPRGTEMYIYTK